MCHKSNLPIFIFMMQGSRRIISISLHTEVLHLNVNATEYLPSYHCISHRETSFRTDREHKYRFPIALRTTTNVYKLYQAVRPMTSYRTWIQRCLLIDIIPNFRWLNEIQSQNQDKVDSTLCASFSFFVKNHKVSVHSIKCIHPHVSRSQYRSSCSHGKIETSFKRTTTSVVLQKRTSLFLKTARKTRWPARMWIQPAIYPSPHLSRGLLPSTNHRNLNERHQSHCCVRTETNIKTNTENQELVLVQLFVVLCLEWSRWCARNDERKSVVCLKKSPRLRNCGVVWTRSLMSVCVTSENLVVREWKEQIRRCWTNALPSSPSLLNCAMTRLLRPAVLFMRRRVASSAPPKMSANLSPVAMGLRPRTSPTDVFGADNWSTKFGDVKSWGAKGRSGNLLTSFASPVAKKHQGHLKHEVLTLHTQTHPHQLLSHTSCIEIPLVIITISWWNVVSWTVIVDCHRIRLRICWLGSPTGLPMISSRVWLREKCWRVVVGCLGHKLDLAASGSRPTCPCQLPVSAPSVREELTVAYNVIEGRRCVRARDWDAVLQCDARNKSSLWPSSCSCLSAHRMKMQLNSYPFSLCAQHCTCRRFRASRRRIAAESVGDSSVSRMRQNSCFSPTTSSIVCGIAWRH